MATYKVLQDIEAEDKLLGPLTFRQFIYGLITAGCIYFCVLGVMKHIPILLAFFVPPALFTGFFAFPWGRDQPTEVWALAKIQFLFKPHRRIWDQSGVKELVTITAPKRHETNYTNGLSQTEVKSRLHALADTLDSRGWVTKNVNVNMFAQPPLMTAQTSDRLIDISSMPQEVPGFDVYAADDILDAQNNPVAQQFDQMINASSKAHRQKLIDRLKQPAQPSSPDPGTSSNQTPADYWFLNQSPTGKSSKKGTTFAKQRIVLPGALADDSAGLQAADPTPSEEALAEKLRVQHDKPQVAYSHLRVIQPPGSTPANHSHKEKAKSRPKQADSVLLQLASNDDLNVSTIARQANKSKPKDPPEDEVVISLR